MFRDRRRLSALWHFPPHFREHPHSCQTFFLRGSARSKKKSGQDMQEVVRKAGAGSAKGPISVAGRGTSASIPKFAPKTGQESRAVLSPAPRSLYLRNNSEKL